MVIVSGLYFRRLHSLTLRLIVLVSLPSRPAYEQPATFHIYIGRPRALCREAHGTLLDERECFRTDNVFARITRAERRE